MKDTGLPRKREINFLKDRNDKNSISKYIMRTILAIMIFLLPLGIAAQRHANNWLFGEKAGITFNDCSIRSIPESRMNTLEGVASYSDSKGNLILYTDGVNAFNSQHEEIENGAGLKGHHSATQSAIILPDPQAKDQYYIFTVSAATVNNGFRYSIVDMSWNEGKGKVIEKNVEINESATEKLIAVRHKNKKDTWIIMHKWESDEFLAYLLTDSGLSDTPVVSNVGTYHGGEEVNKFGYMKVSPDGSKLALAIQFMNLIEIFDFDNETGKVSNPLMLTTERLDNVYGVEFSPNGRLLYVGLRRENGEIFQLDLRYEDDLSLLESMKKIGEYKHEYGGIQIAPNGKIYVALNDTNLVAVIQDPNTPGFGCHYLADGIKLQDSKSMLGLPTFVHPYFNLCLQAPKVVCEYDDVQLSCNDIDWYETSYRWVSPTGREINQRDALFERVVHDESGFFKLYVTVHDVEFVDSVFVEVLPAPETEIDPEGSTIFCDGQSLLLNAYPKGDNYQYQWSTGATTDTIWVNSTGTYILAVENEHGCYASDTIETTVTPNLDVHIDPADTVRICEGDNVVLMATPAGDEFTYKWSNGETRKNNNVDQEGSYWVEVVNEIGCSGRDTVFVDVIEKPAAEIIPDGPVAFCEGDSVGLSARPGGNSYEYLWSNGSTAKEITVYNEGEYTLEVTDQYGCTGYDTITVSFVPPPDTRIELTGTNPFCPGDSVLLEANPQDEDFVYTWSTGDQNESIIARAAGEYILTITNASGCSASDTLNLETFPQSYVNIIAQPGTRICRGDEVILSADIQFPEYKWSTGENSESIMVKEEGIYILTVTDEYGCNVSDTIRIEYMQPAIEGIEDLVYDKTLTGNISSKTITLTNTGQEDLNISNAYALYSPIEFIVDPSEQLPYLLEIGESMDITIDFSPLSIKEYSDSLVIEINSPCDFRLTSSLKGIGVGKSIIFIPEIESRVGDIYDIDLVAHLNVEGEEARDLTFNAKMRFNSSALYVLNNNIGLQNKYNDGGDLVLEFSGNVDLLDHQEKVIASVRCQAMLYDNKSIPLIIEDFEWEQGVLGIETIDGVWETLPVCIEDIRQIEPFEFEISANPNPVRNISTINIDPQINCSADIILYNSHGRKIIDKKIQLIEDKRKEIEIDLSQKSNGVYFYLIRMNDRTYTLPIIKID